MTPRPMVPTMWSLTKQTSLEISFLGSPKDSIFYSIARLFYQKAILCCHQNPVANSFQVQNRLQIIWNSIESHATLQWIPIWCPMLQLMEHSSIEQTSPLWGVRVTYANRGVSPENQIVPL